MIIIPFRQLTVLSIHRLSNQKENASALSTKIKNMHAGGIDELQQEINSFSAKQTRKRNELDNNEHTLKNAESKQSVITKRVDESDRKFHSLLQEREREQELFAEKGDYVEKLCADLNINVDFNIKNSNERVPELMPKIREALAREQECVKEISASNEKADAEQEQEIRSHREQEVRLKSEIASTAKQLKDSEQELAKHKNELRIVEQSSVKLKEIQGKIAQIQVEIFKFSIS